MRCTALRAMYLAATLPLVAGWPAHAASPGPLKAAPPARMAAIGFAGPLADPMVSSARFGAQLAIEEANEHPPAARKKSARSPLPPLQFELMPQDDKNNINLAGYVARYFVNSRVIGVLGHWNTAPSMAAAPTYEEAGIAQVNITPTSRQLSLQGYRAFFRLLGSTDDTAARLAESVVGTLAAKRVAVIHNDTPFSIALSGAVIRELVARAIPVIRLDAVSAKTSDFNAVLKAAVDSGADLIFFGAVTGQLAPFVEGARRMNVGARILLTGGAISQKLDESGRVYALEPSVPAERCPSQRSFQQRYQARYGTAPTLFSRDAYDAAGMLIQAARQTDSNEAVQITAALRTIRYQAMGGEIQFDQDGSNAHPVYTLYRSSPQGWQSVQVLSSDPAAVRCARG